MWILLARRALPYVLAGVLRAFGMHRWDSVSYSRLQAKYSQYQAEVAEAQAASEKAAADALQVQIKTKEDADTRNQAIIEGLHHEVLSVTAAHSGAERVLAAACKASSPSSGNPLPKTGDKPGTAEASGSQGNGRVAEVAGTSAVESAKCFEYLDALQAQIIPQVH